MPWKSSLVFRCAVAAVLAGLEVGTFQGCVSEKTDAKQAKSESIQVHTAAVVAGGGWRKAEFSGAIADTVGAFITAKYSNCPKVPVVADLWLVNQPDGINRFQNRCRLLTDAAGVCYFKSPVPVGLAPDKILVRLFSIKEDCSTVSEFEAPEEHQDYTIGEPVVASPFYRAYDLGRTISVDKEKYRVVLDRATGATFEFYHKHSTGTSEQDSEPGNAIHANMGAALQIAFHDQQDAAKKNALRAKGIEVNACGGQGYWNPTQAGAYCRFNNNTLLSRPTVPNGENSPRVSCDGLSAQDCSKASSSIEFGTHRVMNWDYGKDYAGPYNPLDQFYLSQTNTAEENYFIYDLTLENRGVDRRGFVELPTFYFTNNYRKYLFKDPVTGVLVRREIPRPRAMNSYYSVSTLDEINWVTFKNTSGRINEFYTIAWFYDVNYKADIWKPGYSVSEAAISGAIKFVNYPMITLRAKKIYRLRYVVFPYRFSEPISSKYGVKTVEEVIAAMRAEFSGLVAAPVPTQQPAVSSVI